MMGEKEIDEIGQLGISKKQKEDGMKLLVQRKSEDLQIGFRGFPGHRFLCH
jgi:hypothetical protein